MRRYAISPFIHALNSFRIVWAMGGYGSGKTAAAFECADALYSTGRYRYILSNVNSVWTDSPEDVQLRDDAFVDAIVVLDEGGLFMRLSREADAFMLGLRKLNITIIVPSVLPPNGRVKILQLQRVFNGFAFGLPLWAYEYRLNVGSQKEKGKYIVKNPQGIFGVYDTLGYPVDDCWLGDWFEYWMHTAKEVRPEWVTWGPPPEIEKKKKNKSSRSLERASSGQDSLLEVIGGELETVYEGQERLSDIISLSSYEQAGKKRKKRV